jgi:pyruvate,water dikinase
MDIRKIFQRISENVQGDALRDVLKKKYLAFESLLKENNHVLLLMADMEEKLSGEYLFDRHYIDANVDELSGGVRKIIEHLNVLSHDKYGTLRDIYEDIGKEIESTLSRRKELPSCDLTVPLEKLDGRMWNVAGGKIAHLGELRNRLNLLCPEGFSISASAFKAFMEHNGLPGRIDEKIASMGIDDMTELNEMSAEIQAMVIAADIPPELEGAIRKAVDDLVAKVEGSKVEVTKGRPDGTSNIDPSDLSFSVRSSAIHEDGEFSFAGQYGTFLNVPSGSILRKYKKVVASLFTPRALFYCKTKGFSGEDLVMAVGVLCMVDARSGGVMYTRDPNDPEKDSVIINALWGLGKAVVDGDEVPQSFIVSRDGSVTESEVPGQHEMYVCAEGGGIKGVAVPDGLRGRPCLTDGQIETLLTHALTLEAHYGKPQDVEWAVGTDGRVYILQSRPLRTFSVQQYTLNAPRKVEGYPVLIDSGVIACRGVGSGKAFVLKEEGDLKNFPEGAVLVARHTSPRYVTVMNKASAIVTDVGSATGHMASLSREYRVPTILDTEAATRVIKNGEELTVDAINCNIYSGRVVELLEFASDRKRESFRDTRIFTTLGNVLKKIVPLNLVDPDSENFKPECCATYHDITRFCHEMAMAEIFKTGKGQDVDSFEDMMSAVAFAEAGEGKRLGAQTSALKAGIPIDAHLLDIDGGLKSDLRKVRPEDITSIPYLAFLKGLRGMRWPEPRAADVKGFMGMIAHTASIPEDQLQRMGGKSYAIISRNYMNFSIRLGYHFSMVEAYAGENMNDNYIKFFFKGGGAATDRRLRRVRLIREILKKMDFKVTVVEDVIDAMLTKYKLQTIEEKLEVMGKLTVYTKQLDMAMYNDAVTDMFIEDFVRDHLGR